MKGEGKVKKRSFSFINFLLSLPYIVEEEALLKRSLQMMPVVETPEEENVFDDTPGATSTSTGTPSSSANEVISRALFKRY